MDDERPVAEALRVGAFVLSGLASAYTFGVLFLASGQTGSLFAWSMSPLTAATLGSAYAGSAAMAGLAARADAWASVRSVVAPLVLVVGITFAASVVRRGELPLGGGPAVAFVSSWLWLAVHAVLASGLVVGLLAQLRSTGATPAPPVRFPRPLAAGLVLFAGLLGVVGVALLLHPARTGWWPWPVGVLDAEVYGGWCLALAVGLLGAVRESDLWRIGPASLGLGLTGLLGLVALARYPSDLSAPGPVVAAYAGVLALMALTGLGAVVLGGPLGDRVT